MVGDTDHGEDKMSKGAREAEKTPAEIAEMYTTLFLEDLVRLGVDTEGIMFPKATEYIGGQIAMVRTLEQEDIAYRAKDGIYFDTSKFRDYGKLGGADKVDMMPGARIEKIPGKRNAKDFVLWRDAGPMDLQVWDSPWGRGNPGWHIECSAMIRAILGIEIDIHTGGMDLIPTHHNNEIAQSESANRRPLARYWVHNGFLNIGEDKISKSLDNTVFVTDVIDKGFHPLALRYFYLQGHYRTPLTFSWDAVAAANEALTRLWRIAAEIKKEADGVEDSEARSAFVGLMRDDLSTPQAIALLWESLKSDDLSPEQKWGLILAAEPHLGLSLTNPPLKAPTSTEQLPADIQELVLARDLARSSKDFAQADALRYQLQKRGYRVDDGPSGTLLTEDAR